MKAIVISDLHSDDLFVWERIKLAKEQNPDVVFLLGDIKSTDLYVIENAFWNDEIQIPIYGITGDDDTPNMFDKFEHITNIDSKVVDVCGYKVGGFAGSVKYRNGLYSMRKEEEAKTILDNMPPCDIFLSHETGLNYMQDMLKKKEEADARRVSLIEEKRKEIDVKTKFQILKDKIFKKTDDTVLEHVEAENTLSANEDRMYLGFAAIDEYIRRVKPKLHLFGHYHLDSIAIADSASIVSKQKTIEGKLITIKTVEVKEHKELTAFDIDSTTCACNYLFSLLEMGDRFAFQPLIPKAVIDYEKETKRNIENQLFQDSYACNLSKRERAKYYKRLKG